MDFDILSSRIGIELSSYDEKLLNQLKSSISVDLEFALSSIEIQTLLAIKEREEKDYHEQGIV